MHIIIGGAETTGQFLAEEFSTEDIEQNYSITVIDENARQIQKIHQQFNVTAVCANFADFEILKQNITPKTSVFVACSEKEETNIIACILAHSLGVKNNIAVTKSLQYNQKKIISKYLESGLRHIINITKSFQEEILKLAKFSASIQIKDFAKGKVVLYGFIVEKNFPFLNLSIHKIPRDSFFLIGAVSRDGKSYIPDGNWKIQEKDKLFVLFPRKRLLEFEKKFIQKKNTSNHTTIFGEINLVQGIAMTLLKAKFHVYLICKDKTEQEFYKKSIPQQYQQNCHYFLGSPIDYHMQKKISKKNNFLFIALSTNESDNLTACMIAKYLGIEKTIATLDHRHLFNSAQKMGVDISLSKKAVVNRYVQQLIHYGNYVSDFTTIENTDIEVLSLTIQKPSPWINQPLHKISIPQDSLIGIIIRNNNRIVIPSGKDKIQEKDQLIFFTLPRNLIRLRNLSLGID